MDLIVAFNSQYGATERYALEFANRHGVSARSFEDAESALKNSPDAAVVVFTPNYAGQSAGVKWLAHQDLGGRRAAVAVVGMTLTAEAREKDIFAAALPEEVARFYLPGRLAFSELSRVHRATMWGMHKMLRAKKNRTANEEAMYQGYDTDEDRVDFSELDPLDAWLAA